MSRVAVAEEGEEVGNLHLNTSKQRPLVTGERVLELELTPLLRIDLPKISVSIRTFVQVREYFCTSKASKTS